jgi:hypothetical protein
MVMPSLLVFFLNGGKSFAEILLDEKKDKEKHTYKKEPAT